MARSRPPENDIPATGDGQARGNALIDETSPYLLQHAHNPVHWYPWGEEALTLARDGDKPVLLSIGYSACHWCHVMAHESFEDEATAAVMNRYFINIKVDREERPDLDRIYQTAHQLLTQRPGGWPLTVFLNPHDHVPFFAGTYFPPEPRFGMPGFSDLLERIATLYETEREAIEQQNRSMLNALQQLQTPADSLPGTLTLEPVKAAVDTLMDAFDREYGGFGGAPKFPQTPTLGLLQTGAMTLSEDRNSACREMLDLTLMRMATGGIYDHLGGGFSRYTVDQYWLIPHFEKMLYDNGPLLQCYSQAWQDHGTETYRQIATETAEWILREMQSAKGGYYSSLDADSEGLEGKFYIWSPDEVRSLLEDDEYRYFSERYGLAGPPNFEGHWHLHISHDIDTIARTAGVDHTTVTARLQSARQTLLQHRSSRVWPGRDDKILTAWNALAIKGMATAAMVFDDDRYLYSAESALGFIHETLWHEDRLYASYKDGKPHLNAYLDDYVYLLDAILTLLTVRWDSRWFGFAIELAEVVLEQFEDTTHGGFYFTSHDHEQLIQRRRDFMDDAIPSGNGVAVQVLIRLAHLTGESTWLAAAERTLKAAWQTIDKLPHAHASLLQGLLDFLHPDRQIIIRGDPVSSRDWQQACREHVGPRSHVYTIPTGATDLPPLLQQCRPEEGVVAYICEGFSCREPVRGLDRLISDLMQ